MGTTQRTVRSPVSTSLTILRMAGYIAGVAAGLYGIFWLLIFVLALIVPRQQTQELDIAGQCDEPTPKNDLTILAWNLGYAGTGAEADFFMDGGRGILAKDKKTVVSHLDGMTKILREHPSDVYFLQEVDSGSRRTYHVDEANVIKTALKRFCSSYALNHDVPFIPYPYTKPLGRVRSGLLSLASSMPSKAVRYQLPGSFSWPDSAFHLQRCLLAWRLPRADGREWVLINIHLEAWDDGNIRKQELAFLRDRALDEYRRGNYVVVGGDWNSVLPGVRLDQFPTNEGPGRNLRSLPVGTFPAGWSWGADVSLPSNRRTNAPYRAGTTYTTVIDGFVVSPNVHIDSIATVPRNFEDTDHEPVFIHVVGSPHSGATERF